MITTKPMTNADLLDLMTWLETKPADEKYDMNSQKCLLAEYFRAKGIRMMYVGLKTVDDNINTYVIPTPIKFIAYGDWDTHATALGAAYDTFGEALSRAQKIANELGIS